MRERFRIVEAHEVLNQSAARAGLAAEQTVADPLPRFDLERDMWRRGRFSPSLFATSQAESDRWCRAVVRDARPDFFPPGGRYETPDQFWHGLARGNACEEHSLQQSSGYSKQDFNAILMAAEQSDLLMRLPRWVPPGTRGTAPAKLYWIDPGLHFAMLGWDEAVFAGRKAISPKGLPTLESHPQYLRNSWEGFVITSLVRCASIRARAALWRSPNGEIDLILTWPETGEIWAIEVTMGKRKAVSSLRIGQRETQASRVFIVYQRKIGEPKLDGRQTYGPVDLMTLEEALLAVRDSP